MKGAVFLDRDGTLIFDKDYLHDPALVELIPRVVEGLQKLTEAGYLLFLLTNQSGVGRGYFRLEDAVACNQKMMELLGDEIVFQEICIAPEAPGESSLYRKPSPLFIEEMLVQYNLLAQECFMVGDRQSDIESGLRAGVRSILLECGKEIPDSTSVYASEKKVARSRDLFDAVEEVILKFNSIS